MKQKENKVYIQIGTNDGNDEFNRMVRRDYFNGLIRGDLPLSVILVEPNKDLNEQILKNYEGMPIFIYNVAIVKKHTDEVELVIPNEGNRGKNNYTSKHYSLLPMDNWGNDFKDKIKTVGITFSELCLLNGITHIDFLQIDTEGYDCEIIKSIDFPKVRIDTIKYEDWSFPESAFSRYGKKAKEYGVNGMQQVEKLLTELGYHLTKTKRDIIATR